jgi:nucleoside-diphosphate-sugar epimerase
MRIFVTGGTGFIGSHFVKQALAAGHEVVALRREGSHPAIPLDPYPEWVSGDLENVPDDSLAGCDALVHLAAQGVSPQPTDWQQAFQINLLASLKLTEQASRLRLARMVACGSCFEYGLSGQRYERIPVDAPLEPVGPYAASKAAFTLTLAAFARESPMKISLLRPFHLYGEGQHPGNLWPALKLAAMSGKDFPMTPGEQLRDYSPVEAIAADFLRELDHDIPAGTLRIANLGSGEPVTLKAFAEFWWKNWNSSSALQVGQLPYRDNEIMRYLPLIPTSL